MLTHRGGVGKMSKTPYIAFVCSYTEHPFAKGVCYEAFTELQKFYS